MANLRRELYVTITLIFLNHNISWRQVSEGWGLNQIKTKKQRILTVEKMQQFVARVTKNRSLKNACIVIFKNQNWYRHLKLLQNT